MWISFIAIAIILLPIVCAETAHFTIADDATLDLAVANAREYALSLKDAGDPEPLDRLSAVVLLPHPENPNEWLRGSFEGGRNAYPASCVKLPFLASAMDYATVNNLSVDWYDQEIRPMIKVSDNIATGEVVDEITQARNVQRPVKNNNRDEFDAWLFKRERTERFLSSRGLHGDQTILHKTYPSNSGPSPSGWEAEAQAVRGGNLMNPTLSASLMLEMIYGEEAGYSPKAAEYMRSLLLQPERYGDYSALAMGMPPGSVVRNKIGIAYDTLEDIAHAMLPNGKELIVAVYSNGWNRNVAIPYDAFPLANFMEKLLEEIGYGDGIAKVIVDDADAGFVTRGNWDLGSAEPDKYGGTYKFADGAGTGSAPTSEATFHFDVPEDGEYDISVFYPDSSNRATNAPFIVNHLDGKDQIEVDQTTKGACWVLLGTFFFSSGTGSVTLSNANVATGEFVVADAIKAELVPPAALNPTSGPTGPPTEAPNPPCTDVDGDGYCAEQDDCNDKESAVNPGVAEDCSDGIDNDCDSWIDNVDPDCQPPQSENCSNGVDDDGDGSIDCDDTDCAINGALNGLSCDSNSDCCSGNCRGGGANKRCRA